MSSILADALAVAISARLPVALVGPPGVGKTSVVEALGATAGAHVEVLVVAQAEPTDLRGIPFVDAEGIGRVAAPDWYERVNAAEHSLLLLDEFTQASPLHQGVCNDIIQSRRVGSRKLRDSVRIVAGYNPPEMCGGYDLSLPTRNRFLHLEVEVDPADFADGLVNGWPAGLEVDFDFELGDRATPWRRVVGAFVRARPGLLVNLPGLETAGGGFPTPRSLEMAANAAAASELLGASSDVLAVLVTGAIGVAAATELIAYSSELDLPDPLAALRDPAGIALPTRPDRAWAAMHSVAETAVRLGTAEAWEAAWVVADRVARSSGADVAAAGARLLAAGTPPSVRLPRQLATFRELFA